MSAGFEIRTLLAALAAVSMAALAPPARSDSPQAPPALRAPPAWRPTSRPFGPDAERGKFVALGGQYTNGYACIACHGQDGAGDSSGAFPRLGGQSEWYLYSTLNDFAIGIRSSAVMTPIARSLGQREMEDVAAYYASLGPPARNPASALPIANDKRALAGRDIALEGYPGQGVLPCVGCHGASGEGREPLFPFIGGQYEPYLAYQLRQFKTGGRGDRSKVMATIASGLSDDDIDAVSAYFASLMPQRPTPEPALAGAQRAEIPAETTHLGAAPAPKPGAGDVVVPGATVSVAR
ncbi:MAG TPA: c-type cytochrome [Gammaproteobacteria bacterium]|nr:c-type cytochrome [Gammaproteobacteria bacterium]